jgi:hypothetical protein
MKLNLHDSVIVEVVLRKKMTVKEYKEIFEQSKAKGWLIQGFQVQQ